MVEYIWILAGILVFVFVWNIVLSYLIYSTKKKNELFFDDDSKNLRELVMRSINDHKTISARATKIEKGIEDISKIIEQSYQKFAMVRYSPFEDTGGDQSFSLALLNLQNTGFVITSMHARATNRVYAKEVVNGKSKHNLSAEEVEAIRRAINEG